MMKETRNFKNIGEVALSELVLNDGYISVYIPIENMSEKLQAVIDTLIERYKDSFQLNHPTIDTSDFSICVDTALNIMLNPSAEKEKRLSYYINTIIWYKESENTDFEEAEFCDEIEIDLNAEDALFLKKFIITGLVNSIF